MVIKMMIEKNVGGEEDICIIVRQNKKNGM
jgi:hypothetical protein